MSAESFEAHVRAVQEKLALAVVRAGLTNDAYARVTEAQSEVLGLLPEFLREMSQPRQPPAAFTNKQLDEMRDLLSAIQAAGAGARAIATRPLMTSTQIKFDVLPHLLAAFKMAHITLGALLLLAVLLGGIGIGRYLLGPPAPPYAAVTNCEPLPLSNAGEAFSCKFYTRMPTPASR